MDVMFRCELNYYYGKQLLDYCLQNQLIYKQDPIEDDEPVPIEECHVRYFITQKGEETRKRLTEQLGALGYVANINPSKSESRFLGS